MSEQPYKVCRQCGWSDDRPVASKWTMASFGTILSQNALGANNQTNYKYRKMREKYVSDLKGKADQIPTADAFRCGIITRYYNTLREFGGQRAYDLENLIGGCKPLLDVLRNHYGLLVNDSPPWWRGYYHQEVDKTQPCHYSITLMEFKE